MIKLIACDLDGTLLRDDKTISEYSKMVLNKCKERGIYFVIATARSPFWLQRLDYPAPDAVISNNGCIARIEGQVVYERFMSEADYLLSRLAAMDIKIMTEGMGSFYQNFPIKHFKYSKELQAAGLPAVITDFAGGAPAPIFNISAELDVKRVQELEAAFPSFIFLTFREERSMWVYIADKKVTKWTALSVVLNRLGVDKGSAAAFGDDFNDIDMLRNVGMGVAVDNAVHKAKQAATYIAPTNEDDGVAKFIEEFIL